jgi:hypothetical protein
MEDIILKRISQEIEMKYNCKVLSISYAQLLSLCVMVKVQFNDDFLYQPFNDMPKAETICFSERSMMFYKRVDLFNSIKKDAANN